ncbi:hypothetical protein FRC17_000025 [Serendipita sp. 399]|nr:hypothetical protein FRC17_000025 [Serendipita sp. 399]
MDFTGQRFANMAGTRKEIELNEFKGKHLIRFHPLLSYPFMTHSITAGLTAPEDRSSQRYKLTRLPTPVPSEPSSDPPEREFGSHQAKDDYMLVDKPLVQLPLSPISNPPLYTGDAALLPEKTVYPSDDSYVPSFLPPFPTTLMDQELDSGDPDKERMEERRREEEIRKQNEAENAEKEKQSDEPSTATQSFPANYIVPAPYEGSKLQARGAWHLPALSKATINGGMFTLDEDDASSSEGVPFVRGSSTNDELLAALRSLSTADTNALGVSSSQTTSTNPLRHKVSLIFLGTTPARFNTPDTMFGLSANLSPTPRPGNPLPTYVEALDPQPGVKVDGKSSARAKGKDGDLPLPPSQGKSIGLAPNAINPVSGIGSRIPGVGRALLAKPTLTRTKRLGPPPVQKREEKNILYHSPNPPIPAHWNNAVSGANAALGNVSVEPGKGRAERNPFGVAEATLGYTWDWNVKNPRDSLDKVKASVSGAPAPAPALPLAIASPSLEVGKAGGPTGPSQKERSLPKLSLNVSGRKSSMLSTSTPVSAGGLIARLPGLAERSYSSTSVIGTMPPPPVPSNPLVITLNRGQPSPEVSIPMTVASPVSTENVSNAESMELDPQHRSQLDSISAHPQISNEETRESEQSTPQPQSQPDIAGPVQSYTLVTKGGNEADMDIDAALAEVIGEEAKEESIVDDIEADIVDALGPEFPTNHKPSSSGTPPSHREPEADGVLAALLLNDAPAIAIAHTNHDDLSLNIGVFSEPLPQIENTPDFSGTNHETLGKLSLHSATLPMSTSALRSTTTPAPFRPTSHTPESVPVTEGLLGHVANVQQMSSFPIGYERLPSPMIGGEAETPTPLDAPLTKTYLQGP